MPSASGCSPPLVCSKGTSQKPSGLPRQRQQPKNRIHMSAGSSLQNPRPISPRAQCIYPSVVLLWICPSQTLRFSPPIAAWLSSEILRETWHHTHHPPFLLTQGSSDRNSVPQPQAHLFSPWVPFGLCVNIWSQRLSPLPLTYFFHCSFNRHFNPRHSLCQVPHKDASQHGNLPDFWTHRQRIQLDTVLSSSRSLFILLSSTGPTNSLAGPLVLIFLKKDITIIFNSFR